MNNPKPVPPFDLVVNFENSFGIMDSSIPCPVSLILIDTFLSGSSFFSIIISIALYL